MLLNELFQLDETGGVGVVAANKKMAKDPRYSMSMTADVKPGETQRQAKKFGNSVDKMGLPPVANTNGQIAEATMSSTIQGRNPVSPGARGLMGARWGFDKNVDAADKMNSRNALDMLAHRLEDLEFSDQRSLSDILHQVGVQFHIMPDKLEHMFHKKYNLTMGSYAAKLNHAKKSRPRSV
jgi:hypothetical protein